MELKDVTLDQLGTIKKVIVTKDHTTMIAGNNPSDNLKQRIESIENQLAKTTSSYDQKQLKERLGKLSNGVATIKVGATTESELKEKKLRIEDALNATKAAVEEGIVIGGGAALVEAYKEVKPQLKSDNVDVQKGIHIVMEALFAPIQQIAENAGYNAEDIVESQKLRKRIMVLMLKMDNGSICLKKESLIQLKSLVAIIKCLQYCFIIHYNRSRYCRCKRYF